MTFQLCQRSAFSNPTKRRTTRQDFGRSRSTASSNTSPCRSSPPKTRWIHSQARRAPAKYAGLRRRVGSSLRRVESSQGSWITCFEPLVRLGDSATQITQIRWDSSGSFWSFSQGNWGSRESGREFELCRRPVFLPVLGVNKLFFLAASPISPFRSSSQKRWGF